jgi:hypothetical protein
MRYQTRRAMKSMVAACLLSERAQPMNDRATIRPIERSNGTILEVDPVRRELRMEVGNDVLSFYVPLACLVTLNNERVKLRMLQPCDHATIDCAQEYGISYALSITVDWDSRPSKSNGVESRSCA